MEAFLTSTLTVGIAEMGDRSLFLALLFGIRYPHPWPIFLGMALGLFLNQAISALIGVWVFNWIPASAHAWILSAIFLAMAIWMLFPEKEEEEGKPVMTKHGLFWVAAVSFFILEMADKTQVAVISLAGAFDTYWPVVLGASLGILLVTTPALWLGQRFAHWLPLQKIKYVSSAIFVLLAGWMLFHAI
ncbi:TMEM165/GDT1 family protein [Marinospirillum sp.]|uniref:TMEM165/GDT1 family protein n=1 Tax=Marinospirillum sp. TaxID=2183934 RepID=UPI00286FE618|nr:TMEM165/GDT1 family protein [Marinospirillum sp.]MDR9467648.1 TMEM165/GDT1 family protein [Marinospirillum sp.]